MITTKAKIQPRKSALRRINSWRLTGQTIVFTNGCFDLLHPGHVTYLEAARSLGDRLVVGVNGDGSVRRLKGDYRPILPIDDRLRIIAGLECVDLVVPFHEDTPLELMVLFQPDIISKGGDYDADSIVGAPEVKSWNGRVEIIPFVEGQSTTGIVERVRDSG